MRKLFAIFLLSIHLYNLGGYIVLFQYFIYQSNHFKEEQISKNLYKSSDLVEVKIPVNLPNINNWNHFERISGTIQLQENWYNYVKLRMTRDTLFVMCVPNYRTTKLINANIIYAREVSEAPLNAKKQTLPLKNISIFKYIPLTSEIATVPSILVIKPAPVYMNPSAVSPHLDVLGQPPEMVS
ncbi:hypothetical protein [Mucilaginibacter agri]|uniref:Uncharacterized protein n=1 Tax=Mucilaginibacter agri TaxID=2695265 RepID=A0A965ZEN9_9SPHI|nr:hypothetical protein [Mucilaginibacter agri]NCD69678.1 hypothetical protein [Mucilaginibacter agri]